MKFDYTYFVLFGHPVFEPMVLVTNFTFLALAVYFFNRLKRSAQPYARNMALFMLMLGISTGFGAIAHAVHYQLGVFFFDCIFFITNALSLFSIYFCFKGSYLYHAARPNRRVLQLVMAWIAVLLVVSLVNGQFELIKIHAGIVLIYSLIAHYLVYRRTREKGSRLVVTGILISFLSIIVHSLHLSFSEWFNYKDIAHVIMIITLIWIYRGVALNVAELDRKAL